MTGAGQPRWAAKRRAHSVAACALLVVAGPATALTATYRVGPTRPYHTLQEVAPLLAPGDVVEVDGGHTYPGGVVFSRAGSPSAPITIRGVRVGGQRPVISGGVNTLHFETPWPYTGPGADWYIVEGLEITGGSSRCLFHQAADLVVRDTVIRDCPAHGILGADAGSGSLTLDRVEVFGCGDGGSRHQIYMATDEVHRPGSVFRMQHCYVHDGNGGNNVKSRAERNEIYCNWIEGAFYHELELIGPDPGGAPPGWSHDLVREDSDVVGNVLRRAGPNADFYATRIGGDGTGDTDGRYRFVNNSFLLVGDRAAFRAFDGLESLEVHSNVFFRLDTGGPRILRTIDADWATGSEVVAGEGNWVETGVTDLPGQWTGTVSGDDPGLADPAGCDPRPVPGSPLVDAGAMAPSGPPGFPFPAPLNLPLCEPPLGALPEQPAVRVLTGTVDIGAYELAALFADGFESGDTTAWTVAVPP
mgnify:FL=1